MNVHKYVYKYLASKWIYLGFYDFNFDITLTKSLVSLDNKSFVMIYINLPDPRSKAKFTGFLLI